MSPKTAMSLEAIAAAEGLSATTIRKLINRALLKLRGQPTVVTARELVIELESHRASEHTVRRTAARRGGAE
jgi:uncharacterized protein (DUF2252 family)